MDEFSTSPRRVTVPLFPLPNVVLLPGAILPLHVFEHRYRQMTADALRSDRQLAMALLQQGWERDYYATPAIDPVICIGTIISAEHLPDGNYNVLLQGHTRATILREIQRQPYRIAQAASLVEPRVMEIDLENQRTELVRLFRGPLAQLPMASQFQQLLDSPMPIADVADLVAFNFIESVPLKQSLLAETDVRRRVERVVSAVQWLEPLALAVRSRSGRCEPGCN